MFVVLYTKFCNDLFSTEMNKKMESYSSVNRDFVFFSVKKKQ